MIDRIKSASNFVMNEVSYIDYNYGKLVDSYSSISQPIKTEVMAKDMLRLNWECNERLKEIERLRKKIETVKDNYLNYGAFVICISIFLTFVITYTLCGK